MLSPVAYEHAHTPRSCGMINTTNLSAGAGEAPLRARSGLASHHPAPNSHRPVPT
jgi:hypothetical protein